MCRRRIMRVGSRKRTAGFTLVECMLSVAIVGITSSATISLLGYALMHNELEQERSRAHQMVCQKLEIERCQLFTWTRSNSVQTLWDNATPLDPTDDTTGTLTVIVKNAKTGEILTLSPDPAVLVSIEATLEWYYRGGRLEGMLLRETAMTYKAP